MHFHLRGSNFIFLNNKNYIAYSFRNMPISSFSFVGVTQSLPMTAYIKMIDIWMILMMLYPFFVVTLYTVMEVLRNNKSKIKVKKSSGEWIDKEDQTYKWTMRTVSYLLDWGLPVLVTIFIIIYWTMGLVNYASTNVDSIC